MEPTEHTPPESPSPQPTTDLEDIERSLQETEELLSTIKQRYAQVQQAKLQQPELETRLATLKEEINAVQSQLSQTWEALESQLITWRDKEELFWQFLRFAGIGFALAMLVNVFVK
ncbi:MAG TPA: hypothetical protein V6D19_01160 [Stenomitos sp.]